MAKQLAVTKDASRELLEFESPSAALMVAPVARIASRTSWTVTALVASMIAAAGLIPVDRVVTATGRVISREPTQVVQPLDTAIVRSINVTEGEVVHKGQLLARLDPTFAAADLGSMTEQTNSLKAEIDRLSAEAAGKPYIPGAETPETKLQEAIYRERTAERKYRIQNYDQKISELEATISRSEAEADYYHKRLAVASSVEQMRHELQRLQVGSKLNSLAATDNKLEMARDYTDQLGTAEAAKRELQAQIAERDAFEKQWQGKIGQDLQDEGRKYAEARDQLKKATLRHQLVELRADTDAIIQTVAKVSVGSVMQSGAQFITLVPLDAPLEVEADIRGSDAGFVKVGDPATLKFDTFPFTVYGGAEGTVRVISPDSFTSAGDPRSGAGALVSSAQVTAAGTQTYYLARVTLDKVKLHGTPPGFHITPGMPVTAELKVGKRTVLAYLLGRVLPVVNNGMREP